MQHGLDLPRIVLVTRKTRLELLLERHGTLGQVRFYLGTRGQQIASYEEVQERQEVALSAVQQAIPTDQRRTRIDRTDLDRFVFNADDLILVVGQDGLIPNVAKYLDGQLVFGINPDPERYDGILCIHAADAVPALLDWSGAPNARFVVQHRTMALACREDGQRLRALNEFYLGSRTHQSARYLLQAGGQEERQSSSGVIVGTGTGSTGWCLSIARQRGLTDRLPAPEERRLVWFVREPWPSLTTGTEMDFGELLEEDELVVTSELGENGVVFADGIESDWIEFLDGQTVRITLAPETLNLVVPAAHSAA